MTESQAQSILRNKGPWEASISQGLNKVKFENDSGAVLTFTFATKEYTFEGKQCSDM